MQPTATIRMGSVTRSNRSNVVALLLSRLRGAFSMPTILGTSPPKRQHCLVDVLGEPPAEDLGREALRVGPARRRGDSRSRALENVDDGPNGDRALLVEEHAGRF